jgi:hypothetical protein
LDEWGVSANDLPTTFTFTGQLEAADFESGFCL